MKKIIFAAIMALYLIGGTGAALAIKQHNDTVSKDRYLERRAADFRQFMEHRI